MATYQLHKVYFTPGTEIVAIAVQALGGLASQRGAIDDLYTTQQVLAARASARLGVEGATWGDEDVIAEASAQLSALGDELATP